MRQGRLLWPVRVGQGCSMPGSQTPATINRVSGTRTSEGAEAFEGLGGLHPGSDRAHERGFLPEPSPTPGRERWPRSARDHDDAVVVGNNEVAGREGDAVDLDGNVEINNALTVLAILRAGAAGERRGTRAPASGGRRAPRHRRSRPHTRRSARRSTTAPPDPRPHRTACRCDQHIARRHASTAASSSS